jgi:hypothetical protein
MKRWILYLLPILLVPLLAIYFNAQKNNTAYQTSLEQVMMRKLVHQLLLSSGDSASRILPVKQVDTGVFHLYPQNHLAINPDTFMAITSRLVQQYNTLSNFTVQVKNCDSTSVSYGFAVSSGALVATCGGRQLPSACYYFEFIVAPATANNLASYWWYIVAVVAAIVVFAAIKKRTGKIVKTRVAFEQPENKAASIQEADGINTLPLGRFLFLPLQQCLMQGEQKTMLTDKESKVLHLLAGRANTLVERNLLQQEIWENEGVIVTRSLDMFISKLRKKLAADPDIKILNIHGKGYKLIIHSV